MNAPYRELRLPSPHLFLPPGSPTLYVNLDEILELWEREDGTYACFYRGLHKTSTFSVADGKAVYEALRMYREHRGQL